MKLKTYCKWINKYLSSDFFSKICIVCLQNSYPVPLENGLLCLHFLQWRQCMPPAKTQKYLTKTDTTPVLGMEWSIYHKPHLQNNIIGCLIFWLHNNLAACTAIHYRLRSLRSSTAKEHIFQKKLKYRVMFNCGF